MKRVKKLLIGGLLLMSAATVFAGCDETTDGGEYKVYFNYNYQQAPEAGSQKVTAGETLEKPDDPVRDGYVFIGWYTNVVCTEEYDFSAPVAGNMRLFAGWSQSSVTVTFNMNYAGGTDSSKVVEVGKKLERPADPEREDYRFDGWYSDAAGLNPFDFDKALTGDTAVYAKWVQTVATVTFVRSEEDVDTQKIDIGECVERPADPEREDYAFDDWYAAASGNTKYDFGAPVTGDVRIYAHWNMTRATITLDENYEGGGSGTIKVSVGEAATEPEAPSRVGHDFIGWYLDRACTQSYDFTAVVNDNLTLFAKWELSEYTVTFNGNYEGATSSAQKVKYKSKVTAPDDPARSGYDFTGWYLDEACTQLFVLDSPVTGDLTVYAGWLKQTAAGERIYTYLWNYADKGTYTTQTYTSTRRATEPDVPEREGYYFAGWAKDADGTDMYDFKSERTSVSRTLYAVWLKGYTFEAEYTYLTGKPGQGSSDNCSGVDLIQSPKDVNGNGTEMGMSNGYYVGKLYYNGAFLEFDVTSSEEVFDAVLVVRLTPDLFDMFFTDETWQVIVNGERVEYGELALTGAIAQTDYDENGNMINGDMYKRPFEDYVLTVNMHLLKGENVIKLVTNNSVDHGGTFNAETPLIDCIYIYTNATLTWTNCYPENVGQTMADVVYDVKKH